MITALALMVVPLSPLGQPGVVHAENDIVLTQTGGSTVVDETPASTDQVRVRLSDEPDSTVIMSVSSSDPGEATVDKAQLVFTPANFDEEQVVTIAGVEDTDNDGPRTITIEFQVTSAAADYTGKTASLQVTTLDNEPQANPGFTVVQEGGETRVNESGTTDTFMVRLNRAPTGAVVLNVTSDDTTEVTVAPGQLTFTTGNWSNPQTVTVTGVDDSDPDGDRTSQVIISVNDAATADNAYDAVANQTVSVVTVDNEAAAPGLFIEETGGNTTTSETGTQDTFTVRLTQQPDGNVVINVTNTATDEVTVDRTTLTFTPADWDTPQTVTVTGVDDAEQDGPQAVSIVLSINRTLSSDDYDAVADITVTVTNQDDEPPAPGINVSKASVTVSEAGSSETFTVSLNTQPASDVVVSLTSSQPDEASVSPTELRFTPANWDSPQTVTVTGVDDSEVDGDQVSTITLAVVDSLSDDGYDPVPNRTVTVTTTDDDPASRIAPVPLTPSCGAKLDSMGPALTWAQEPGARWFQVQVIPFNDDGPGINLIIGDPAMVAATQYDVKEPNFGAQDPNYVMLPDLTYRWQVRTALTTSAPGDQDWGPWSANCTFETQNKSSSTVSLQNPVGGSSVGTLRPTLQWTNSDREVFYYEVQLSRDSSFSQAAGSPMLYWELRHGGVTDPVNSYIVPSAFPLEGGQTYFWRVRPRIQGDGMPVAWTAAASFRSP